MVCSLGVLGLEDLIGADDTFGSPESTTTIEGPQRHEFEVIAAADSDLLFMDRRVLAELIFNLDVSDSRTIKEIREVAVLKRSWHQQRFTFVTGHASLHVRKVAWAVCVL